MKKWADRRILEAVVRERGDQLSGPTAAPNGGISRLRRAKAVMPNAAPLRNCSLAFSGTLHLVIAIATAIRRGVPPILRLAWHVSTSARWRSFRGD